jgi:hypothetical protein
VNARAIIDRVTRLISHGGVYGDIFSPPCTPAGIDPQLTMTLELRVQHPDAETDNEFVFFRMAIHDPKAAFQHDPLTGDLLLAVLAKVSHTEERDDAP